jgi:hypothetical protein
MCAFHCKTLLCAEFRNARNDRSVLYVGLVHYRVVLVL